MKIDISKIKFSKQDLQKDLKLPNKLSNELAYLCGVLAGDGHISKNYGGKCRNDIYCSGNPKDEVEYYNQIIIPLFFKLFNIKLKARYFTHKTYGVFFGSKAIYDFLTQIVGLSKGKKYTNLKIPKLFLKDKKLINFFICGVFDTDGGFSLKKRYKGYSYYPVICFVSKSKKFIDEIYKQIFYFGIQPTKPYRIKLIDKRMKKGFTIVYRFEINGHSNLIKWYKIFNFRHPKHIIKFTNWKNLNNIN
ncbi:MAG: LAGLIDADG family homing endonuclease [Candidatus Nanoarchaeia archaeon]|nr:LAGLIDADG family homing endonuclease [Candidatus Nanoarchaeia archaeon]